MGAWEGLRTLQIDRNVKFFDSAIIMIVITIQGRPTSHELPPALPNVHYKRTLIIDQDLNVQAFYLEHHKVPLSFS